MIQFFKRYASVAATLLIFISCTKEKRNEREIAGVWRATSAFVRFYDENPRDSAIQFFGTMQLQNKSTEDNIAFFVNFSDKYFSETKACNWQVSSKKPTTINFFLIDPSTLTQFSYTFNIEKISRRKLVLCSYVSDAKLNLKKKVTYEFEAE